MPWGNQFLDSLDRPDIEALTPALELVPLKRDQLLTEVGRDMTYAYLPTTCIVSVVAVMRDGRSVESRTIGRESGVGLLHALGARRSFERLTVQVAGDAYRLPIASLSAQAARSNTLVRCLVYFAQTALLQVVQSSACNSLHSAEQRLCRWLLLTQDRLNGSEIIPLTQEHLAIMLGVQRTTVTEIAGELQAKGHIAYSRGVIRILDRESMLRCSCECYSGIENTAAHLRAEINEA